MLLSPDEVVSTTLSGADQIILLSLVHLVLTTLSSDHQMMWCSLLIFLLSQDEVVITTSFSYNQII